MKSLEEIILNTIVGSVVINYRGEKRVVTAASVSDNYTGFNGSYVFTLELQLKDDYPIEIGLSDKVFVSLPTTSKPDLATFPSGDNNEHLGGLWAWEPSE